MNGTRRATAVLVSCALGAGCAGGGSKQVSLEPPSPTSAALDRCRNASQPEGGGECLDAYRWLAQAGSSIPDDPELFDRLGLGARTAGDMDAALRVWRDGMRRFPKDPRFHLRVGALLLDQWGAGFEAYGPVLEAVRLEPGNGRAHRLLADALQAMGRHREAVEEYSVAGKLLPPDWHVAWGQASALIALARLGEALVRLQAIEPLEQRHHSGTLTAALRADVLLRLGRFAEAEQAFRGLLRRADLTHPERRGAWCGLSLALLRIGRDGEAREACRTSRSIVPHGVVDTCQCSL